MEPGNYLLPMMKRLRLLVACYHRLLEELLPPRLQLVVMISKWPPVPRIIVSTVAVSMGKGNHDFGDCVQQASLRLRGNSRRERRKEREKERKRICLYIYIKLENEWSRKILRYQLQESRFCERMEEKRERKKEKEYVYIYIKLENEWS